MEYLKYRFNDRDQEVMNKERGIKRKVSTLKSFYNYFYRAERLNNNPAARIQLPKLREKEIIRLDVDEVALLLDEADAELAQEADSTMDVLGYGTEPVIPSAVIEAPLDSDR